MKLLIETGTVFMPNGAGLHILETSWSRCADNPTERPSERRAEKTISKEHKLKVRVVYHPEGGCSGVQGEGVHSSAGRGVHFTAPKDIKERRYKRGDPPEDSSPSLNGRNGHIPPSDNGRAGHQEGKRVNPSRPTDRHVAAHVKLREAIKSTPGALWRDCPGSVKAFQQIEEIDKLDYTPLLDAFCRNIGKPGWPDITNGVDFRKQLSWIRGMANRPQTKTFTCRDKEYQKTNRRCADGSVYERNGRSYVYHAAEDHMVQVSF